MKKYKWWFLVSMLIEGAILLDLIAFIFTGNNIFYSGDQEKIFVFRIFLGAFLACIMYAGMYLDCLYGVKKNDQR